MCECGNISALGNLHGYPQVPGHDFLVVTPNRRAVRYQRGALQIAIKPRLVGWKSYGVRT